MTQDQFNEKVIEGLVLLQAYVATPEFEQIVLNGTPLVVDATYATKPVEWTNHLQVMVYRKMGLEVGLLSEVEEHDDGFSTACPADQPAFVGQLTMAMLEKCSNALRDQMHAVALAGGTQAQQLQGVHAHVVGLLYQSRQHLAGAHAAPVQH